jgi:hypothetical protein
LFLLFHVAVSLVGIFAGLVVLFGLLRGNLDAGWTALFLVTTILTSATGFPLPPFGFDPPRAVGVLSLVLLALAVIALYGFRLGGAWSLVFVVSAVAALYLNVFVGVTQAFQKLSFLQPLAPTLTEPPFLGTQLLVLAAFVLMGGVAATRRQRLSPAPGLRDSSPAAKRKMQ